MVHVIEDITWPHEDTKFPSTQEEKFRISKRPCNVLFSMSFPPLVWVDTLGKCQYTLSLPWPGSRFHCLVVARDGQRLWEQTLNEKPEWSPDRRLQGRFFTFRQLLHSGPSSVVSTLSCHWTQRIRMKE